MGPNLVWMVSLKKRLEIPTTHWLKGDQVRKVAICSPRREASPNPICWPLGLRLLAIVSPDLWENTFLLLQSPSLWHLVMAPLANPNKAFTLWQVCDNAHCSTWRFWRVLLFALLDTAVAHLSIKTHSLISGPPQRSCTIAMKARCTLRHKNSTGFIAAVILLFSRILNRTSSGS